MWSGKRYGDKVGRFDVAACRIVKEQVFDDRKNNGNHER